MKLLRNMATAAVVAGSLLAPTGVVLAADAPDDPPKPEAQPRRDGPQGPGLEQLERFREELGLDEKQMEKLQGLGETLGERIRAGIERFRDGGEQPNPEDLQGGLSELFEELRGGLEGILTDEQREKLQERLGGLGEGFNPEDFQGGEGLNRLRDMGRQALLEQIKNALLLNEEEQEVLLPLIENVMKAQSELQQIEGPGRNELTSFLRSGADQEAIQARLTDFRTKRTDAEKKLEAARKELRELLTFEQEAKLVAFGILR